MIIIYFIYLKINKLYFFKKNYKKLINLLILKIKKKVYRKK
jgi:hypothetical protein